MGEYYARRLVGVCLWRERAWRGVLSPSSLYRDTPPFIPSETYPSRARPGLKTALYCAQTTQLDSRKKIYRLVQLLFVNLGLLCKKKISTESVRWPL